MTSSCWHSFRLILQKLGLPVFEPEKIEKHENRQAASMRQVSENLQDVSKGNIQMQERLQKQLDTSTKKVKKMIVKAGSVKLLTSSQKSELAMLMNQKQAFQGSISMLKKQNESMMTTSTKLEMSSHLLNQQKVFGECIKKLKKAGVTNLKGLEESTRNTEAGLDQVDEVLNILNRSMTSQDNNENIIQINDPDLSKFSEELKELEAEVEKELEKQFDELEFPAEKKSVKNLKNIVNKNNNRKEDVVLEIFSSDDEEAEGRVESLLKSSKKNSKQVDSD